MAEPANANQTSLKTQIGQAALRNMEYWSPTLKESKFLEEGKLTPEEFVAAGDLLVLKCPTWQWATGDPAQRKAHLPADKQYLRTPNVPCLRRATQLESGTHEEQLVEVDGDGEDGDWLATHAAGGGLGGGASAAAAEEDDIPDMDESMKDAPPPPPADVAMAAADATAADGGGGGGGGDEEDEDEDIPDMEGFEEGMEDELNDVANLANHMSLEGGGGAAALDDNIVKTRTYDVSITYDKYYQCPRVWLYGYSEDGAPLTQPQVLQDISAEHAHKTCTMEPHPHLANLICASIHPCKHTAVMKKLCQQLIDGGRQCRMDQYLFLFLKFMSTFIPTIEYDHTISMDGR